MRGRGLKQATIQEMVTITMVAPHAGAWIETSKLMEVWMIKLVAPHAGAWIETIEKERSD